MAQGPPQPLDPTERLVSPTSHCTLRGLEPLQVLAVVPRGLHSPSMATGLWVPLAGHIPEVRVQSRGAAGYGDSNGSLQTRWDRSATPSPLHPTPSILEVRVLEMETKQQAELAGAHSEKEKLQRLLSRQSGTIEEMEKTLLAASANTSLLQRQQLQLLQSVQSLVRLVSQGRGERGVRAEWGQWESSSSSQEHAWVPLWSAQLE